LRPLDDRHGGRAPSLRYVTAELRSVIDLVQYASYGPEVVGRALLTIVADLAQPSRLAELRLQQVRRGQAVPAAEPGHLPCAGRFGPGGQRHRHAQLCVKVRPARSRGGPARRSGGTRPLATMGRPPSAAPSRPRGTPGKRIEITEHADASLGEELATLRGIAAAQAEKGYGRRWMGRRSVHGFASCAAGAA
jgi:hypothetical protein